ncbi:endolytic transglycosylase MltG [Chitinibacteraceae bacterium HSL-7]
MARKPANKTSKPGSSLLSRLWAWLLRALFVAVLGAGALAAAAYWYVSEPLKLAYPVQFTVGPGSVRATAAQLEEQGVIGSADAFRLLARVTGQDRLLKAGVYRLESPTSLMDLMGKIARGEASQIAVTVIEGWNWRQLRAALAAEPKFQHRLAAMSDAEVLALLGSDAASPEGLFFPDTYFVSVGAPDTQLLQLAYRKMQSHLAAAWALRAADSPLKSPYELLTLASIVEKETGHEVDRGMVSGVFNNRLRIGMRLQTDPTVIYGLGEVFDGNLRKRDLRADTPYNSYTRAGLPPTPIAMPGEAALLAAIQPSETRALYFVARGDGTSHFSETLDEHNRAVNRYIRGR